MANVLHKDLVGAELHIPMVHGNTYHDHTYVYLDGTAKVPIAQMADGAPDGTKFIRDDRTLSVPVVGPVGCILAYGGATAPSGYLMCDGAAVSRTDYATLFSVLGIAYGPGNGTTTFNVPDLRQRFPLGKATAGTGSTLGGTGGAIDHTHTGPNHTHIGPTHTHQVNITPRMSYGLQPDPDFAYSGSYTSSAGGAGSTSAEGTGATGLNNPPFQVVNYIVKY